MVTIAGFLMLMLKDKLKFKNCIEMKNKPDPALIQTTYLSNEIKKRPPKSREPIP
jgi:hypothetical protein